MPRPEKTTFCVGFAVDRKYSRKYRLKNGLNMKLSRANLIYIHSVLQMWHRLTDPEEGRWVMKHGLIIVSALLALLLLATAASADQIILRDGTIYTGTFIRGDSRTVDFRILGRTENFQISDIGRIEFSEPPAVAASETPALSPEPAVTAPQVQPVEVAKTAPAPSAEPTLRSGMDSTVTFPEGTAIVVRTTAAIDTDRNRVGDAFDAILDRPLEDNGRVIAPRGSKAKGRISYAEESGKLSGRSQLMLELTELIVNGKSTFLRTADYVEEGSSRGQRTAATVGGTAALGAIIGAIAGGGKGAAIGAASGAGVGTGVQILTRGEVLKIPAETILEFQLQSPMTLSVP